jgi:uncharacterized membrane protein
MKILNSKFSVLLSGLLLANFGFFIPHSLGALLTLMYFLVVPGYLILILIKAETKQYWQNTSLSVGLSLLIIICAGLVINALHATGVAKPLNTTNAYIALDIITVGLLICARKNLYQSIAQHIKLEFEKLIAVIALTLLPFMAAAGAFRLNNGASNVLTMILFASISCCFIILVMCQAPIIIST